MIVTIACLLRVLMVGVLKVLLLMLLVVVTARDLATVAALATTIGSVLVVRDGSLGGMVWWPLLGLAAVSSSKSVRWGYSTTMVVIVVV